MHYVRCNWSSRTEELEFETQRFHAILLGKQCQFVFPDRWVCHLNSLRVTDSLIDGPQILYYIIFYILFLWVLNGFLPCRPLFWLAVVIGLIVALRHSLGKLSNLTLVFIAVRCFCICSSDVFMWVTKHKIHRCCGTRSSQWILVRFGKPSKEVSSHF